MRRDGSLPVVGSNPALAAT